MGFFGALSLISFGVAALAVVALFIVATAAVRRYPRRDDPARNAKRYTVPALMSVCLALFALAVAIPAGVVAILT